MVKIRSVNIAFAVLVILVVFGVVVVVVAVNVVVVCMVVVDPTNLPLKFG